MDPLIISTVQKLFYAKPICLQMFKTVRSTRPLPVKSSPNQLVPLNQLVPSQSTRPGFYKIFGKQTWSRSLPKNWLKDVILLQVTPLTEAELEAVTIVFHQYETGLREGTIYTKVVQYCNMEPELHNVKCFTRNESLAQNFTPRKARKSTKFGIYIQLNQNLRIPLDFQEMVPLSIS